MQLRLNQITKRYPNGHLALNDLSLEIDKGMFGLLGPNGAGKSSLMRTIATLQLPDHGQAHFGGINIVENPMDLRRVLGYLPQEFGVYSGVSALELLDYLAVLKGLGSKKERRKVIDYVLDLTNLTDVSHKDVKGYSGGMKQRFGIAQLLLNNPKLLIVDEPTAGLDPSERNRFLSVLRSVGTESLVIFSTHIVEDVRDLCNDMAVMNEGRVKYHEKPSVAVKKLEGKVWTASRNIYESVEKMNSFDLLSSGFNDDGVEMMRVFADQAPIGFSSVSANLEDVYFHQLKLQS